MSVLTLIPFGAGAFALLVYAISLAPSITWAGGSADSGELAMAAYHHGVAHPTGYPTWVTLAWLFTHLPFGNVAYRVNLLSAVSAALAVGLMALLIVRTFSPPPLYRLAPALAGSLLLAFSPMFWSQAVVTEVYALNALFVVLVLLLYHRSLLATGGWRLATVTGLALGAGAANHLTLLLLIPGIAMGYMASGRRLLPTAYCLLPALALGLSVYLLVPLRAATAPPFANWGDPSSPDAFVAHITGAAYRGALFSLPADLVLSKVPALARMVLDQFGWHGYALALVGLWAIARQDRPMFLTWTVTAFLYVFFALNYPVLDSQVYLLPFFVLLALAIGWGAAWLVEAMLSVRGDSQGYSQARVPVLHVLQAGRGNRPRSVIARSRSRLLPSAFCLLLAIGALFTTFPKVDRSADREAHRWAEETLASVPSDAVLVAAEDRHTFSLWYLQYVEGHRPDVGLLDARLLDWSWYRRNLAATYPDLRVPEPGVSTLGLLATLTGANARRPVLFTFQPPGVETRPEGPLFRATR